MKKGNDVITFSRKEKVVRFGGKGPYLFGICFRWLEKVWVKMASSMCTSAVVWTMSFVQANNAKSFKLVQSLAIAKTGLYILTQPATDSTKLQQLFFLFFSPYFFFLCYCALFLLRRLSGIVLMYFLVFLIFFACCVAQGSPVSSATADNSKSKCAGFACNQNSS